VPLPTVSPITSTGYMAEVRYPGDVSASIDFWGHCIRTARTTYAF
jgi:hypothetical protein